MTADAVTPCWYGEVEAAKTDPHLLAMTQRAKSGDWDALLEMIDRQPFLTANRWRPDSASYYAPLHQAAWHGAPADVVLALVAAGAWRRLRTRKGETAADIARRKGHGWLLPLLQVEPHEDLDPQTIPAIDAGLALVVEKRIRPHITTALRHPTCEVLLDCPDRRLWYPVDGMYGGFSIQLRENHLYVESWSRVVGGSGLAHVITPTSTSLVKSGFAW